jgi:hypothetical protein
MKKILVATLCLLTLLGGILLPPHSAVAKNPDTLLIGNAYL